MLVVDANNSYLSPIDENYSLLEKIKRKNASNLIIKTYRKYKLKSSFGNFSNLNTPRNKTINFTYNNNNNKENLDIEQYDSENQESPKLKNNRQKTLVYIGEKIDGIKEGFGIKIMPNNVKYIGFFKNNKSEGYGKFINENKKDIYYGEFSKDQANGFGVYRHKNETSYYGEWKDDLRENYGIEKWQDKAEYCGQFHLGEKNGIGKYIFSDGSRYEGEWKNNNLDGYGIYYYLGQRIYIGQWKNNLKNGRGILYYKEGKMETAEAHRPDYLRASQAERELKAKKEHDKL